MPKPAPKEIPRNPPAPKLNQEVIELLTNLCFRRDDKLEPVDLIFLFSTADYCGRAADVIKFLLARKISSEVMITGGLTDNYYARKFGITESGLVMREIDQKKYPQVDFFIEKKSTNTLANVVEALKVLDFSHYHKILFIFKSHAVGRGYLTLRKFLPNTKIFQIAYNTKYPKINFAISRDNWYQHEFSRGRVWGEFLRIKRYGERGDIEFEEVREMVDKIDELII